MSKKQQEKFEDIRTLKSIKRKILECEKELGILNFKTHLVSQYLTVEMNTIKEHIDWDLENILGVK